ncbi:MAG: hypothetical protein ACYSRQ_05205 [Planctomycetota bacterium]|jgi:Fe-S-cluster containining protein
MKNKEQLLKRVAEVYQWLDEQVIEYISQKELCSTCGKCCCFTDFDHSLFVSSPEIIYFHEQIGPETRPMTAGQCPYNINDKCTIYENRFAGCRTFFCKGEVYFQGQLSESVLKKFKEICLEFNLPYRYVDLQTALSEGVTNICRSDGAQPAGDHST